MSKKELIRRYVFFLLGLFVNSLGISLITKANLGTSPISSIPYTLSLGFPLSLGMFTMIFSMLLMVIQLVILRKRFSKELWLQLPGECTVRAISSTWNTDFGKTKVAVDVTMAVSAALLGVILYWQISGVREGSLISALLVGFLARLFNRKIGEPVQTLLCDRA